MINYALIGEALLHPTKKKILTAFIDRDGATLSPSNLADILEEPLGNVSYHVNDLAGARKDSKFIDAPILQLAHTAQRRGALEHFYRLTAKARLS